MVNLRARACDPEAGRFVSWDSFGGVASAPQTANRYAYALNSPYRCDGEPEAPRARTYWQAATSHAQAARTRRTTMSAQTQRTANMASTRAIGASRPRADADTYADRVLTATALSSIAAGAINVAAGATVGRSATDTLAFFVAVAAAQVVWGALALLRAPRWWLALGAAGNLVVATTWLVSRTVGLPVGTVGGSVLPVGFADGLATALEVAVVVGCVWLLIRGASLTRSATRSPGTTAAIALVVGALALAGVLAQTGAIGSSSNGYEPGGGGGPSNPGYGY